MIEFFGRRMCLTDWAAELGVSGGALQKRLARWPLEEALSPGKHDRNREVSRPVEGHGVRYPSINAAARAVGTHPKTVWQWLAKCRPGWRYVEETLAEPMSRAA